MIVKMGQIMQIIGITGLPSSGKGAFSNVAKDFSFHEIVMGDVIRKEITNRGLELTRENSNQIMIELRKERGDDIVAELTLELIEEAINQGETKILIDGIRSLKEVEYFKDQFPNLQIIAIHANPDTRYLRSKSRQRKDDAYSRESFDKRDRIELSVGIGEVIALADILINSPSTLEEAQVIFSEVLEEVINVDSTPLVF